MDYAQISDYLTSIYYAQLFAFFGRLEEFLSESNMAIATDDYYDLFFVGIENAMDFVAGDYIGAFDANKWYLSDPCMVEYYRLCRLYGSKHGLKLKDNPFMVEAERQVDRMLHINAYDYGYTLLTKYNHPRASGVVFYCGSAFNGEFELVEAMLYIKDWFETALIRLRHTLLMERVLQLPLLPPGREENDG